MFQTACTKSLAKLDITVLGNQVVLWVDTSMFLPFKHHDVSALIELFDNTGTLTVLKPNTKVRRPHPNKNWAQVSARKGRKVIEGVPYVFSSLEELRSITEIRATWFVRLMSCIGNGYEEMLHVYHCCTTVDLSNTPGIKDSKNIGIEIKLWDFTQEENKGMFDIQQFSIAQELFFPGLSDSLKKRFFSENQAYRNELINKMYRQGFMRVESESEKLRFISSELEYIFNNPDMDISRPGYLYLYKQKKPTQSYLHF